MNVRAPCERGPLRLSIARDSRPPENASPRRHHVSVWALDVDRPDLDASASGAMVGFFLHAHAVGKATLTATYGR